MTKEHEDYRKKVLHWWENEQLLNHNKLLLKYKIGHTMLSYNEIDKIYKSEQAIQSGEQNQTNCTSLLNMARWLDR